MKTAEDFLVNKPAPVTTRVQANRELYKSFSKCFKLPYWDKTMCHTEVSQTKCREVSWGTIEKTFKVTPKQLMFVMSIYKKIETGVAGWSAEYNKMLPRNKNKARITSMLIQKEIIKVVNGRVIFNPAINIARHGWSQFSQGCMLVQWQNETLIPALAPSQQDSKSLEAGCLYAIRQLQQVNYTSIPYKVKGKVEGVV